jgi:hypothetical protein
MSRLQLAIEQIVFARNYTVWLLGQTREDDWFRPGVCSIPDGFGAYPGPTAA